MPQIGFANPGYAPNAYFTIGANIFENGQSNNVGPAAQTVLEEGMYWYEGDCPTDGGDTEDCDLLRFGAGFHPAECNDGSPPEINHYLPPQEDGGEPVQEALSSIQNNQLSAFCDSEPEYRPVDDILLDHQKKVFEDSYSAPDSPWMRPNLNLLIISDLPQTTDRSNVIDYAPDARAKGAIASTCRLLYGEDDAGTSGAYPAMPTWVMMAREHTSDAATYGGLLSAAGGTGECCYDASYDPDDPNSQPCDPSDPAQQLDICNELSRFSETAIRRGVAEGNFQCAPGDSPVQTGSMDFGTQTRGTLPHILCHFAGENGHNNCTGPQAERNKRRPTDVLGKMTCIRQLPHDYDGGALQLCDRYGDCSTLAVCEEGVSDCSGVQFIDPNQTLFTLVGEADGQFLCGTLADGGSVQVACPNEGQPCTIGSLDGRCSLGRIACEDDREICEQQYEAMPEICNGLDDDCDGNTDNLSTSWDEFPSYDATELGSYDSDGVDRTGVHCFERDVCRCAGGATLDYGGPGYEAHIMSWEPGTCECGEGLEQPTVDHTPVRGDSGQPTAGCSSAAGGSDGDCLWWMLLGVLMWRRRGR